MLAGPISQSINFTWDIFMLFFVNRFDSSVCFLLKRENEEKDLQKCVYDCAERQSSRRASLCRFFPTRNRVVQTFGNAIDDEFEIDQDLFQGQLLILR